MDAYHRPTDLDDALRILAAEPVRIAAGCTDLFPATEAKTLPGPILDITAVEGLRGITSTDSGMRIGAATTWTDVIRGDLPPAFDALKLAAREVGSVQIQNAGTVAGNLCNASPAADGVPCLLVLDASVELMSMRGRRLVPLSEFLTGPRRTALQPGEMVTAIAIPEAALLGRSSFQKLGARKYLVISITMVAARLVVEDGMIWEAAIAVGSCGPVATRLTALEAALAGVPVSESMQAVQSDLVEPFLDPIADIRASAEYRSEAATETVRRVLGDLTHTSPKVAA